MDLALDRRECSAEVARTKEKMSGIADGAFRLFVATMKEKALSFKHHSAGEKPALLRCAHYAFLRKDGLGGGAGKRPGN